MLKRVNLIAIVSMTIVLFCCHTRHSLVSALEAVDSLENLLGQAKSLESEKSRLRDETITSSRYQFLYPFMREPKSPVCLAYQLEFMKVADQYRIKARKFVEESKGPKSWFRVFTTSSPISELRRLSKDFLYLEEATQRLAKHAEVEPITEDDVECELLRFQVEGMSKILYVLQVEIKYLVTEKIDVMNRGIYHELASDDFTASHDFFTIKEPTVEQRALLKEFLLSRIDQDEVSTAEAVEHFHQPTSLVLGRLHDSCHALLDFTEDMEKLEPKKERACSKSPVGQKNLYVSLLQLDDNETVAFCRPFLDALSVDLDAD